jgi:outer membrane protein 40
MKTKTITLALAALTATSAINAQEATQPAHKTTFAKDKASAHWFLEIGDAATISLAGVNRNAAFGDRVSFLNPNLALGRWISPSFGMRLQLQGGKLYDFSRQLTVFPSGSPIVAYPRNEVSYGWAHLDFLWDVTNYFMPYRENRVFHFIPFLGIGGAYVPEVKTPVGTVERKKFSPTVDAGLQLKFRLSRVVDFNIEGKLTAADLKLPATAYDGERSGDFVGQVGASLTFHLGKKEFEAITPNDPALIASLNDEINRLRAENAELSKRPERCPDIVAPVVAAPKVVGNVIYFRINSATIDRNQVINVYNIAEYAKNNTETVTLVGYADRETGTPDYNMSLSKRRAEAVADMLVNKFGISRDRLKLDWKGDTVQPYGENVWNRIVLMSAE